MESFIFTILIWILLILEPLIGNFEIKIAICIIQVILFIAQILYFYYKYRG